MTLPCATCARSVVTSDTTTTCVGAPPFIAFGIQTRTLPRCGVTRSCAVVQLAVASAFATRVTVSLSADDERTRLWQGRKKAFGAMGRIAPSLVVQDAVVPRTRLPEILATSREIGERHSVKVCNVFHAGDGNLHPNIPYDASDADESRRVHAAMTEIMQACIDIGGTITGEHGVGLDKLPYMSKLFDDDSLAMMCAVREAFDPAKRANPGKVVPVHACREWHGTPAARTDRTHTRMTDTRGHA